MAEILEVIKQEYISEQKNNECEELAEELKLIDKTLLSTQGATSFLAWKRVVVLQELEDKDCPQ